MKLSTQTLGSRRHADVNVIFKPRINMAWMAIVRLLIAFLNKMFSGTNVVLAHITKLWTL